MRPRELAALAREAWAFLAVRKTGGPKIRFEQSKAADGERFKAMSVIEIVNDDMPFLVDSVMGELTERGIERGWSRIRSRDGTRKAAGSTRSPAKPAASKDEKRESVIHIHVGRIDDAASAPRSCKAIEQVLAEVRLAVQDWRPMLGRVGDVIAELKANPPPVPVDDIAEAIQFLEWAGCRQLHLARRPRLRARRRRDARSQAGAGERARRAARRRRAGAEARRQGWCRSRRSFAPSSTSRRR